MLCEARQTGGVRQNGFEEPSQLYSTLNREERTLLIHLLPGSVTSKRQKRSLSCVLCLPRGLCNNRTGGRCPGTECLTDKPWHTSREQRLVHTRRQVRVVMARYSATKHKSTYPSLTKVNKKRAAECVASGSGAPSPSLPRPRPRKVISGAQARAALNERIGQTWTMAGRAHDLPDLNGLFSPSSHSSFGRNPDPLN